MNLVWLRTDLRLEDNPALYHGCKQGPTCCLFVITPKQWQEHQDAPAKLMLWRDRLIALSKELQDKNLSLKILKVDYYKDIAKAVISLVEKLHVTDIYFNLEYPLNEKRRDKRVSESCLTRGIQVHAFHSDVIHPPGSVRTQAEGIYSTYTPFSRQWRKQLDPNQLNFFPAPHKQTALDMTSDDIEQLWPTQHCQKRSDLWPSTTKAVKQKLSHFAESHINQYNEQRDYPGIAGTSTLSP